MGEKYFKYYVVYFFENGYGSAEIKQKKKIKTIEDIKIVRDHISENYCSNKSVIILNYIRIK